MFGIFQIDNEQVRGNTACASTQCNNGATVSPPSVIRLALLSCDVMPKYRYNDNVTPFKTIRCNYKNISKLSNCGAIKNSVDATQDE